MRENQPKTNTPELFTDRLHLRKFTAGDTEAVFWIYSDREVNAFLPWFPVKNMEEAGKLLQERYLDYYGLPEGYRYAVCLKGTGNSDGECDIPIGYVHVSLDDSHDLGYAVRKEFWGQGIASEAAKAVLAQMKRDGIAYATATHDEKNPASGRVMEKIGMEYRYSYREQWQPKNIPVIYRMYQINLDGRDDRVYRAYWERYPEHFISERI